MKKYFNTQILIIILLVAILLQLVNINRTLKQIDKNISEKGINVTRELFSLKDGMAGLSAGLQNIYKQLSGFINPFKSK